MAANQSSGGSRRGNTPKPVPPQPPRPASPGSSGRPRSRLRGGPADGNVQTFRSPTALVIWAVWLLFAAANWVDLAVQGRDHSSVVAAALLLLATGIAYVTALRPRIIADESGITVRNPLRDHRISWASVTKVDLVDLLRVHCDWDPSGPGAPGGKKHRKVINSWAVHYSRRRQLSAEVRSRRSPGSRRSSFGWPGGGGGIGGGGRGFGYGDSYGDMATGPSAVRIASPEEADAEMAVRLLSERATAARAEMVWATGTVDIAHPTLEAAPTSTDSAEATPTPSDPASTGTPTVTGWLEPLKSTWDIKALAAVLIPALIVLIVSLVH
jgi:Bacterial PH domain